MKLLSSILTIVFLLTTGIAFAEENTEFNDTETYIEEYEIDLNSVETVFADESLSEYNNAGLLANPDYTSVWYAVNSNHNVNIGFHTGFVPKFVSVIVQVYDCKGYWSDKYSYVHPAQSSWDDLYTKGGNVYWIDAKRVIVHHHAKINGYNIHDGCSYQRFKVYAWK